MTSASRSALALGLVVPKAGTASLGDRRRGQLKPCRSRYAPFGLPLGGGLALVSGHDGPALILAQESHRQRFAEGSYEAEPRSRGSNCARCSAASTGLTIALVLFPRRRA